MECKECGYPLWNLSSRNCPECGTAFCPSAYEFVKNSVQFCCPECNQPYYGTTEKGHLEPSHFACVKCGHAIEMDACVLRPAAGVRDDETRTDEMPWLERKRTGKPIRAFFTMIGRSISAPTRLVRSISEDKSSAGQAIWFATLLIVVPQMILMGPLAIFFAVISQMAGGGGVGMGGIFMLGPLLVLMLGIFVWFLIWMVSAHLVLLLTGSRKGGIGRTAEAISYASGPAVITAVPCIGFYLIPVAGIWWGITAIFTLKERQQISGVRATFAALLFPVFSTVLIVGGLIGLMFWAQSFSVTMRGQMGQYQVQSISGQLQMSAFGNNDIYPAHASVLFRSDSSQMPTGMNLMMFAELDSDQIPVGSGTLADVEDPTGDIDEIDDLILEAVAALPANVSAHRLGSIVYTYHGIDSTEMAQNDLWVMIQKFTNTSPVAADALALDPNWLPGTEVYVADAGGGVETIALADFAEELAAQNVLRASFNLPPLPDPDEVTYERPATGGVDDQ